MFGERTAAAFASVDLDTYQESATYDHASYQRGDTPVLYSIRRGMKST